MAVTRILIVDDHYLSRKAILDLVASEPTFEVVGQAADGEEAIEKTRSLMPDLILMDIKMPGLSGLEATKQIRAEFPYVMIVILSVSNDIQDFFEAIKFGAQGYLLKDMQPGQWLDYLRALVSGDRPVSREMAVAMLREFTSQPATTARAGQQGREILRTSGTVGVEPTAATELSDREQEILEAVAEGLSNREIGERLHIAENTVKNHLKNILAKLQLRNRAQLVAYAYERGWLRPG